MRTPRKAAAILLIATALFAVATPALARPPARADKTTAANYGSYRLDWAKSADMAGAQPLDGDSVSGSPTWVVATVVSNPSVAISVVHWYANGALHRDNDTDLPYDMQWNGYSFPAGTNTVKAVVNFADGTSQDVVATFTQGAGTTSTTAPSTTTTTAKPATTTTTAKATTTTTTPSTTTTAPNGSLPFPGPGTVGHLANLPGYNVPATNLTNYTGTFTTSYDGQLIEGMNISGSVMVKHRNVVIRRNRIGMGVSAIPDSSHPNVSARVEWNTIGPEYGSESTFLAGNGRGENLTFYRNEVFGGIDLFNFNYGGNITIQENWAYGPYQMLDDPYQQAGASTKSHNDGMQVFHGGAHYKVIGNRFDLFLFRGYEWSGTPNASPQVQISPRPKAKDDIGRFTNIATQTTGFLFQQGAGRLDDIVFDGNHFDGDYFRLWSFEAGSYTESPTNVRIVNNTIVRRYSTFGKTQLIGVYTPSNVTWGNNVDERGQQIAKVSGMQSA